MEGKQPLIDKVSTNIVTIAPISSDTRGNLMTACSTPSLWSRYGTDQNRRDPDAMDTTADRGRARQGQVEEEREDLRLFQPEEGNTRPPSTFSTQGRLYPMTERTTPQQKAPNVTTVNSSVTSVTTAQRRNKLVKSPPVVGPTRSRAGLCH